MQRSLRFEAIGTRWQIDYTDGRQSDTVLESQIHTLIERFDESFSRFKADSWVNRVRAKPGSHRLPPDAYELLDLYARAYAATDGRVTPLIGMALEQAGYDASYSLKATILEPVPPFDRVVTFTKRSIVTTQSILLDFGAAGKGYLVDKIAALMLRSDIDEFVINAGGDILHHTSRAAAITVGLENPFDTTEALGTCDVHNASICASAASRRAWGTFTHIIDPQTLTSPIDVAGTWVKAPSAAVADLIATALFFTTPARLRGLFTFDYAVLDPSMAVTASAGFGLHAFERERA